MFLFDNERINIKYFMIGYLSFLLIFSSVFLGQIIYLWRGIIIISIYLGSDFLMSRVNNESWYFPSSSIISGLILSLVGVFDNFYLIFLLPIIAAVSKQILHFGKNRHVFNPAAFSLAFISIFVPTASWWGITIPYISRFSSIYHYILFFAIFIFGLFIIHRQNKWHIATAFFLSYIIFNFLLSFVSGDRSVFNLWEALNHQIFGGGVIFFATVMLIEPMTSTFPFLYEESLYGFLVGLLSVLTIYLSGIFHIGRLDPLIFGLVIGDLLTGLMFLPSINKKSQK